MTEPSNRTILLMDIEGSGSRTDVEQAVIRRMLYAVLRETLSAAFVEATEYRSEDRGDGVFVLIDPGVPKPALIRALLTTTPMRLRSNNRLAAAGSQVRLRLVVHTGEVALDEYGAVGADVVLAFRLLDSKGLKDALAATTEPSVLCVSDPVHHGVVRHGHHGIVPEHFHRFEADSKEGALSGWYHDPTRVARAGEVPAVDGDGPALRAREQRSSGLPDPVPAPGGAGLPNLQVESGNFFFGTARIAGDAVAGDKHVREAAADEGR
ncbi:adenylate/guanylate cyclase domain-containing protein [Streptomyces xantholiticus]|uniref:adenylate/guanylate cyclase domain-containing protein n=1 Tax=Streptomyces xantholiticus TaxID=68285 RepID=UPI00167AA26D|nr:adenylate/guanylate cyclase domain-containing protein [Streptomyces xantholiticus]GGW61699.1 hypothetical protein GCM10010381_53590 [Streptomyces xantholiticus]